MAMVLSMMMTLMKTNKTLRFLQNILSIQIDGNIFESVYILPHKKTGCTPKYYKI